MRRTRTCSISLLIVFLLGASATSQEVRAVLGEPKVLLRHDQFGLRYFPDMPVCTISRKPLTFLMAVTTSTYLVSGPDLNSLHPVAEVLRPGRPGSFDGNYAGVGGIIVEENKSDLIALYHAEDHSGMPELGYNTVPGFYASVGLATSKDGGRSFQKVGPILTSNQPKNPEGGHPAQGLGDPTVCRSKDGRYLLAYYSEHSRVDGRGVQIGLARSPVSAGGRPGTWKKYFEGSFDLPGLGGKETPVISMQKFQADAHNPSVVYIEPFQKYVMVFCCLAYADFQRRRADRSGFYIASSDDGITWSEPTLIYSALTVPIPGIEMAMHPSLLLTEQDQSSVSGWLLYGYSPRWGHTEREPSHHLVGRHIRLEWH